MMLCLFSNDVMSELVGILVTVLGFTSIVYKTGLTLCSMYCM